MFQELLSRTIEPLSTFLPSLLGALGILVVGWIVALAASAVVRGALKRTQFDDRIAQWMTGGRPISVAQPVSSVVYWIIMLFVAIAVFQTLDLPLVAEPLNALLSQLANFVPQLAGALVLLLVAWVVATVLRRIVAGALRAIKIDERVGGGADGTGSLAANLGEAVYWFVFLLFLPAVLGALALEGLLEPVQTLVDELLGFLPNLLGAVLVFGVGWFVANLVRRITVNLLASVGTDALAGRVGLSSALGSTRLSDLIGLVVYVLILLPVLISALNALALDAITAPASEMLSSILQVIPSVFGAVLLLGLAYFIGRLVADLISRLLADAGFDNILQTLGLSVTPSAGRRPSDITGFLIVVAIMLFASIEAASMVGFATLGDLIARFLVLGGRVVLGLIIFGVGLFLANLAADVVRSSSARQANLLALATRVSITVLAAAMALRQMGLASDIINLAFGLLLGAVAVAVALAFGLGARDAAARAVDEWSKALTGR